MKEYSAILLPLILLFGSLQLVQAVSVLETCSDSNQCNKDVGLYCINSPDGQRRCGCPTNETIFDEVKGRCVGKVGYTCVRQGNDSFCPEKAHCSHQDPHHSGLYYYEPKCFCEVNYFGNNAGNCSPAAKFGETCSEDKKCDELARIKCGKGGKCSCEFGEDQYFDVRRQKCVSFVGGNCSDYYSCVENARCDGIQAARSRPENQQSTPPTMPVGKCICEYGFTPTSVKKCLAGFRQTCSSAQLCNSEDDLECQDGSCNCVNPLHMFYDYNIKKCMKLVGAKCEQNSGPKCIEFAECNNGLCDCIKGYSKTPYRRCMLDYKESCENEKCNLHNGLACKNGHCSCVDETLLYDESLKACVSRIGFPCGKIGQAGDYGKDPFYVSCEPKSICKQEANGDINTMFCRLA